MTTFGNSRPRGNRRGAWQLAVALAFLMLVPFAMVLGWRIIWPASLLMVVVLVFLALKALHGEAHARMNALPLSGELPYGFAGHDIRAVCDSGGEVWLRADDVRHLLGLERSDAWMAGAYPDGYRRAVPGLAAWFISPAAVRRHWAGSFRPEVNRFLTWMERELVPLHRQRTAQVADPGSVPADDPAARPVGFVTRHWRGEHPLLHFALSGLLLAVLFGALLGGPSEPAAVVAHYQRRAFITLLELVAGTLAAAWWGVGAWRSAQRWLGSGRSLLAGMAFAMAGMGSLLYAFDRMADFDRQMTVFALVAMATDSDPRPRLTVSADGGRLLLSGEMGFGTTRAVREALARHPAIAGIELEGPGGRAYEGLVLAELVRESGLATYVRRDCVSACVLVFAGGGQRFAAPGARFGLHRSGVGWQRDDGRLSRTDLAMGEFFAAQGIADAFIRRALATPFADIWVPESAEVLTARLATDVWVDPSP
ncbi:MAG: hypothetical protein FIB06_08330 [Betaproteobacteria bacterium]|nr:hypothetical protein [Betaproteobacteria bacterium]